MQTLMDWVMARYPKISLELFERNRIEFSEIKKRDDACKSCLSVQMCPGNGWKMNGRLTPGGAVEIWMDRCPSGCGPEPIRREYAKKKRAPKSGDKNE